MILVNRSSATIPTVRRAVSQLKRRVIAVLSAPRTATSPRASPDLRPRHCPRRQMRPKRHMDLRINHHWSPPMILVNWSSATIPTVTRALSQLKWWVIAVLSVPRTFTSPRAGPVLLPRHSLRREKGPKRHMNLRARTPAGSPKHQARALNPQPLAHLWLSPPHPHHRSDQKALTKTCRCPPMRQRPDHQNVTPQHLRQTDQST